MKPADFIVYRSGITIYLVLGMTHHHPLPFSIPDALALAQALDSGEVVDPPLYLGAAYLSRKPFQSDLELWVPRWNSQCWIPLSVARDLARELREKAGPDTILETSTIG